MSNNELDKVRKVIQQEKINELEDVLEYIKPLTDEFATMSLSDFEKYIKPLLLGELPANDENIAIFYHNVLEITKSYHIPIHVVDQQGKLLFKLPPLIIHVDDGSPILKMFNYTKFVNEYNSLKDIRPIEADHILETVLPELSKHIVPDKDEAKMYTEELHKIYQFYGIDIKDILERNKNKQNNIDNKEKTKSKDNVEDMDASELFDYD